MVDSKVQHKFWLKLVALPVLIVVGLDQLSKIWALSLNGIMDLGPFRIGLFLNPNFMLGSGAEFSPFLRLVVTSTFGGFLSLVFLSVHHLFPIRSSTFRLGFSLFFASVISNVIDRIRLGAVVDFLQFNLMGFSTGVMNLADIIQWVGAGLLVFALLSSGHLLWPENERRDRKWIEPNFQTRYVLTLVGLGAAALITIGSFSRSFLRYSLDELAPGSNSLALFEVFDLAYSILSLSLLLGIAVFARAMSHRIVGPILAFTKSVDDIIDGKPQKTLVLRENDELKHLEGVSERFQRAFHDKLGVTLPPLTEGRKAPHFTASSFQGDDVNLSDLKGQKVWLCFYRWATCPLCIVHIHELSQKKDRLDEAGIQPIIVFESPAKILLEDGTGRTKEFLKALDIPLISDPDSLLYQKYRTRKSLLTPVRLSNIALSMKAKKEGFLPGKVSADIRRLPAHFLIDEEGEISHAHYNQTVADNIPWKTVWSFAEASGATTVGELKAR